MANLAAVLDDLADHVNVHSLFSADVPVEEVAEYLRKSNVSGNDLFRSVQISEAAMPVLRRIFPNGFRADILKTRARESVGAGNSLVRGDKRVGICRYTGS